MLNVNNLKNGITFVFKATPYLVLDAQHSKSGRGQAHVKVKARNLLNQSIVVLTFTGGDKVAKAHVSKSKVEFLYVEDDHYIFLDATTYEQVMIESTIIAPWADLLTNNLTIEIQRYEGTIINVVLPEKIMMTIVKTQQAVRGNTSSNPQKSAQTDSGLVLQVPIFIKENDRIFVNSEQKKYVSKA